MANVGGSGQPVSRERFVWRHTATSTGGAYCEFDLHLGEGAVVAAHTFILASKSDLRSRVG